MFAMYNLPLQNHSELSKQFYIDFFQRTRCNKLTNFTFGLSIRSHDKADHMNLGGTSFTTNFIYKAFQTAFDVCNRNFLKTFCFRNEITDNKKPKSGCSHILVLYSTSNDTIPFFQARVTFTASKSYYDDFHYA